MQEIQNRKKIFWVASFPKSGNSWVRAILISIFFTKNGEFDLSLYPKIKYFDKIENYNFVKDINIDDYNNLHKLSVIAKYWIKAQEQVKISGDFAFYKTHSANVISNKEYHYTTNKTTRGVILIVRDPRDVAVSYSAKHLNKTTDDVIDLIINPDVISRTTKDTLGLPMIHLNWEQFYRSWFSIDVPKLLLKYEDMKKNPKKAIMDILNFFKNEYNFQFNNEDNLIANILKTTDFKTLKTKEKEKGLIDNKKGAYFRSGQTNEWLNKLTLTQIKKIESNFNELMKEFGYL